MNETPLDRLMKSLAGLPGLGTRSARRIALHLLTNKHQKMIPLMEALQHTAETVVTCHICGNLDTTDPCRLCQDQKRTAETLCIVGSVADLWAIERTGMYKGQYHVLGGVLSALDGIGPEDLTIAALEKRVAAGGFSEAIMALSATVDGQTTAHYLAERLAHLVPSLKITRLAHGVPVGGELDYLDDGTITTALKSRSTA